MVEGEMIRDGNASLWAPYSISPYPSFSSSLLYSICKLAGGDSITRWRRERRRKRQSSKYSKPWQQRRRYVPITAALQRILRRTTCVRNVSTLLSLPRQPVLLIPVRSWRDQRDLSIFVHPQLKSWFVQGRSMRWREINRSLTDVLVVGRKLGWPDSGAGAVTFSAPNTVTPIVMIVATITKPPVVRRSLEKTRWSRRRRWSKFKIF